MIVDASLLTDFKPIISPNSLQICESNGRWEVEEEAAALRDAPHDYHAIMINVHFPSSSMH